MDGSFACPECGSTVEVQGLSPGRQTRCEFCNRLVEIPFIPRVADPTWRRPRFRRSRWLLLAWSALALFLVAIVLGGATRLMVNRSRNERLQTVERLTQSSARQRASGEHGLALIDLDAAIELLGSMEQVDSQSRLAELRRTRGEAARQDVEKILATLNKQDDLAPSAGTWLTLRSRIAKDPDLAPLRVKVEGQFQAHLNRRIESEDRAARLFRESRKFEQSLESCLRLSRDLKLLPPDLAEQWRSRLDLLVESLVRGPGVVVTMSEGQLLDGSDQAAYSQKLLLTATQALRAKGYLPPPAGAPWQSLWSQAPFRLNLEVNERREGNYQSTQNRLSRIEVRLILSSGESILWKMTSTSRSRVPLPKIPASFSNRLAISPTRIDEFEKLLYEDAKAMIDDHLAVAVKGLPPCPIQLSGSRTPG